MYLIVDTGMCSSQERCELAGGHLLDAQDLAAIYAWLIRAQTGATDPANHAAALHMVTMQGGVFGAVGTAGAVIDATTWSES